MNSRMHLVSPTTGEPLFDQDLHLEQSFHSDHMESTFFILGYVMLYDPLADFIYTNCLSIGRTKMHNTSETAASSSRRLRTRKASQSAAAPSDKAVHGDLKREGEPRPDDEAECESDPEAWEPLVPVVPDSQRPCPQTHPC